MSGGKEVTTLDLIKAVARELRYRRRVYPRMIDAGKLDERTAEDQCQRCHQNAKQGKRLMPKIPTARRQSALEPTKGELLAEHLTGIAMLRGLYYTALYDKLGENLKLFGVSVDTDCDNELWARTQIQGHPIKLRIVRDDLLHLMDGNGQTLDLPKKLRL